MAGIRSRARQLSLSVTGILVLVLVVGPACVPQELRADAASRIAGLAQYFDTALADAWRSAFPSRGTDHPAGVSTNQKGSGSHPGAPLVLTEVAAPPSTAAAAGLIDINGLGPGSFNAAYGAGSASNSMAGLLGDMLKDDNLGADGGFEALARSSGGGNGRVSSGGASDHHSGGTGASAGGAAPAGLSRSSFSKGSPPGSTPSHGRNPEGTPRLTDVKPDAHQDRVAGLGNGFVSVSDAASAWWKQVASGESLNGLLSDEPGVSDGTGGPHDGGAGNALDPTTGDLVGQLPNGLDHPLQGEDRRGSVFQNEVNGGADSDGGDGHVLDFENAPANGAHMEDHGPFNEPVMMPQRDSGPVSNVPEPASLVLLSLGLGAIILWRKFRSAR